MTQPNSQFLRGTLISSDIGTPGTGLSGPTHFRGWMRLARQSTAYLERMVRARALVPVTTKTGNVPRITIGTGNIRPAAEGATPTNTIKPTHSNRGYSLVKHRVDLEVSNDAIKWAANPLMPLSGEDGSGDYEDAVMAELAAAWGLDLLRLFFLGDTTSADPSLALHDGFVKDIVASGNEAAGTSLGTSLTARHLALMEQQVPERFSSRLPKYEWYMSSIKRRELTDDLAQRATGIGDNAIKMGPEGVEQLYGKNINIIGPLGTSVLLDDPANLMGIVDEQDWSLRSEDRGEYAVREVTHVHGSLWTDTVVADPAGSVWLSGQS